MGRPGSLGFRSISIAGPYPISRRARLGPTRCGMPRNTRRSQARCRPCCPSMGTIARTLRRNAWGGPGWIRCTLLELGLRGRFAVLLLTSWPMLVYRPFWWSSGTAEAVSLERSKEYFERLNGTRCAHGSSPCGGARRWIGRFVRNALWIGWVRATLNGASGVAANSPGEY